MQEDFQNTHVSENINCPYMPLPPLGDTVFSKTDNAPILIDLTF